MKISTEVKTGVLAAIAIALLFVTVNYLKGHTFSHTHKFYAYYDKVNGIQPGTKVLWKGMTVGRVNEIKVEKNQKIRVDIQVESDIPIPEMSKASIEGDAIFGAATMVILPSENKNLAKDGSELLGFVSEGMIDKFTAKLDPITAKLDHAIVSVDTLVNKLNKTFNTQNQENIAHILQSLKGTLATLGSTAQKLNDAMSKEQLKHIMQKVDSLVSNLEQNKGNVNKVLTNSAAATDTLKTSLSKLNTLLSTTQKTLDKMNSSNGTVGKLLNEKELHDNITHTTQSLDSLLVDLKAHPKRYVHFSLFGKKEKKPKK